MDIPSFQGLTAYHDISLDKCYVIELNTTIVLPPRNFWELLMNVKVGTILSPPVPTPRKAKPKGGIWDIIPAPPEDSFPTILHPHPQNHFSFPSPQLTGCPVRLP